MNISHLIESLSKEKPEKIKIIMFGENLIISIWEMNQKIKSKLVLKLKSDQDRREKTITHPTYRNIIQIKEDGQERLNKETSETIKIEDQNGDRLWSKEPMKLEA